MAMETTSIALTNNGDSLAAYISEAASSSKKGRLSETAERRKCIKSIRSIAAISAMESETVELKRGR